MEVSNERQNDDEREPQHQSGGIPFLELPYDIRHLIYRNLLRLGDSGTYLGSFTLWPEVTRTCRQIHSESEQVLYGENIFFVDLWQFKSKYNPKSCEHPAPIARDPVRDQFPRFKSFQIRIKTSWIGDMQEQIEAAWHAVVILSDIGKLDYLHFVNESYSSERIIEILKPFEMLRNVRRVDYFSVPDQYGIHLRSRITQSSPMPKLYRELYLHSAHLICCEELLCDVERAWADDDFDRFKLAGNKVIAEADKHMAFTRERLLLGYNP